MIAAVVPMKPLARAKRRLSGVLPEQDRLRLVRTMLGDVLAALRASPRIAQTFVVTADPELAALAARFGAEHIAENGPAGLNGAVAAAARRLDARGIETMLVLAGDLPLAAAAEIGELASLAVGRGVALVPAHDGEGTNALMLSPPGVIAPAFGPGSCARHVAAARAAGLEPAICRAEGLARDIDWPEDLRVLSERTVNRPEYAFLRVAAAAAHRNETESA